MLSADMAVPTPYSVEYDFEGWQASNPSAPVPALPLQNELANIELAMAETQSALADIRASDGSLAHGSVTTASLAPDLLTGIDAPSQWATATAYAVSDTVFFGPKFYIALTAHTSGTFATDLAAAKWDELADFTPTEIVAAENVTFDGTASGLDAEDTQAAIDELATDMAAGDAAEVPLARLDTDILINFVPVGAVTDYAGATAPAGWLLCGGQAVSRTTYALLYAVIGEIYGSGDESTTFNVPDAQGYVTAGKDNMSGTSANRLTNLSGGVNGDVLGATGGSQSHNLTTGQLASHTHTGTTNADGNHTHQFSHNFADRESGGTATVNAIFGSLGGTEDITTTQSGNHTHAFATNSAGSGAAHNNVQPTLILNKIIFAGV